MYGEADLAHGESQVSLARPNVYLKVRQMRVRLKYKLVDAPRMPAGPRIANWIGRENVFAVANNAMQVCLIN